MHGADNVKFGVGRFIAHIDFLSAMVFVSFALCLDLLSSK